MHTLYIVATPIGNLEDITFRALRVLREADVILCEDTRVTKKLLGHFEIKTRMISYHQHSSGKKVSEIIELLKNNNAALVTDAGTPSFSDPGNQLIAEVLMSGADISVVPIPGSSALMAAVSIAGIPTDEFLFLGFLPHKKGRQTAIDGIVASERTVVLYESKYRIVKLLRELALRGGDQMNNRRIIVCRELTKQLESVYRGDLMTVLEQVQADPVKGEYVVIVEGKQ